MAGKSVSERLMDLQTQIIEVIPECKKFEGGNASAGTRVSKALQNIRKEAKELRAMVFAVRKLQKEKK